MSSPDRFLFHRPVAEASSKEIYEVAHEILSDADFIHMIGRDALHMSLLSTRMLINHKVPRQFMPQYQDYDVRRREFNSRNTAAWEQANIEADGVSAVSNVLVIKTQKPNWLCHERTSAARIANIQLRHFAFNHDAYTPHITVGKFVGTVHDWNGFYECEQLLQEAGLGTGAVTLNPLRLEYGEHSWEFQSRQASMPELESTAQA